MRNGGKAWITLDYELLKPTQADADPASISLTVCDPSGTVEESAAYPGTIVRDSQGHFHFETAALTYAKGGTYVAIADAPGFPQLKLSMVVEPLADC